MNRILLTGAGGGVAAQIRPLLLGLASEIVLSDRTDVEPRDPKERFVAADLADFDAVRKTCAGIEGIIHLGGFSVEGPWDVIHEANIIGPYNLFEAARAENVKRVIFASSNHAIGFYRRRRKIGIDQRVRPDGYYGVSKAYGEALGSLYADKFGIRVMSIRIGNIAEKPADLRRLSIWQHPEDLVQLIDIGLHHSEMYNEICYGESSNERSWWDNESAFRLGYRPKHRAEEFRDHALEAQEAVGPDSVGDHFHGGSFCSQGFSGDLEKI